ncbi:MAG: AtpZ/AtpI family protein [Acidobacteriota bacterium]
MIKNFLDSDEEKQAEGTGPSGRKAKSDVIGLFDSDNSGYDPPPREDEPFVLSNAQPESIGETARKSGLAWSMGVVFFASVVFMMILGWGADLLFGSAPWGLVVGSGIGALIGFIQLFRLSSQILNK